MRGCRTVEEGLHVWPMEQFVVEPDFFYPACYGIGFLSQPLSAREERACLEQMKSPDKAVRQAARSRLIEHNLRLVAHIIKKYYSNSNDQDDLISIGTIGLIKAIDSFNQEKGIRLSSYAARCIENEILMFFRSMKKTSQDISMNEPIESDSDGNALTLMDTLSVEDDIVDNLDSKIKIERLKQYLGETLSPREQAIVCLRYGLTREKNRWPSGKLRPKWVFRDRM